MKMGRQFQLFKLIPDMSVKLPFERAKYFADRKLKRYPGRSTGYPAVPPL